MRSNASGFGTEIKVRAQGLWGVSNTFDTSTTPGQSLLPTSIGLSDHEKAEYVEHAYAFISR